MYDNYQIKLISGLNYRVKNKYGGKVNSKYFSNFVKKFHYKKSLARGCKYNFCLIINGKLAGIANYGIPNSKKYNKGGFIELKRFTLSPNCVKNTASWFMAKCNKRLPNKFTKIISYAEADRHEGTIYKASNFTFMGTTKKGQAIKMGGKEIHLRAAYQKIKGQPTKLAKQVRLALDNGTAKYITTSRKNMFVFNRGLK